MKFGAFVPQGWRLDLARVEPGRPQYLAMRDVALRLEKAGYDGLWLYDHFHTIPEARLEPTFECWTSCAALAEATSTIRIGQMVGCNIYRNPAVLAKMATTLDVISNGRLDFGLGAGWYEHETVAYGFEFERPAQRIRKLDEALSVIRGMWAEDHFQFEGRFYKIGKGRARDFRGQEVELAGVINHPKPVHKPHPPIWVGGGGEQLTLRVVARHADWSNYGGPLEVILHKNLVLDQHCRELGRDPASLRRSASINVMFGSRQEVHALMRDQGRSEQDVEGWLRTAFIGEAGPMVEKLLHFRDQGRIEYVHVYFPDAVEGHSLERFAAEVIPHL
jgi:F420-dependent oxidoreductase-like protein